MLERNLKNYSGTFTSMQRPLTLRLFNRLPGRPLTLGAVLLATLFSTFFVGRYVSAGDTLSNSGDYSLTIIHMLLTAYSVCAYLYLLKATERAASELQAVLTQQSVEIERVGKHYWWALVLAGMLGIAVQTYFTVVTTVDSDPWDWLQSSYDTRWMRVLGPLFSAWISCLLYVLVVESLRLSRLSASIQALDLLELGPYRPLVRQGLCNALLVAGFASMLSLFLLVPDFDVLVIPIGALMVVFAGLGLMLPLSGIRGKIKRAKQQELAWCQTRLQKARDQLKDGAISECGIADIHAYKITIESIRNWPFDSPTLTRFALYLLIPLGSMLGGAVFERALELLLNG